jgi:phosphate transport system permease protein
MTAMPDIPMPQATPKPGSDRVSYTGRKRRVTRRSVRIIDALAKYIICTGGIGVTLAFVGIVAFLCFVVVPLFGGATLTALPVTQLAQEASAPANLADRKSGQPLAMGIDENLSSVWLIDGQGRLTTYRAAGGELLKTVPLARQPLTAISNNRGDLAIGFGDGSVIVGRVSQTFKYLDPKVLPANLGSLRPGETAVFSEGVAAMTGANQLRVVDTAADMSEPLKIGDSRSPIRLVDYLFTDQLEALTAIREDGRLYFATITKKENIMTGKIKRSLLSHELPVPETYRNMKPAGLFIGLNGRLVFLVYADGRLLRYKTDDPQHAAIAEEVDLLPHDVQIAAVRMLLGNLTLIVSDTGGGVAGWFPAPREFRGANVDDLHMVKAHDLERQARPVAAIGTSARDRQFVTCDAAGDLYVRHMTSGTTQGKIALGAAAPVLLLAMSPKNDAIAAIDASRGFRLVLLNNPHADGSLSQLFRPVWYEGYPKPEYVYQSSAGTDDAEAKFSLIPLIFGTMKATFYAMLFAVPIAILGAIYVSEFLHPQIRSVIKPTIEMMASLPSVVLGFIAAIVLAPWVEASAVAVLLVFFTIPAATVIFGFLWQIMPPYFTRRIQGWGRVAILMSLVLATMGLTYAAGPAMESLLFQGDFKGWLAGRVGTAAPGWIILLTPLCLIGLSYAFNGWVKPRLAIYRSTMSVLKFGLMDGFRWLALGGLAVGLALLLGWCFTAAGWDLRGNLVGGYVQRNTFIVGMIMGFAIIPIIFTVSEDSLSSVPDSLRAAALGAGATPWQAAIRVVLPVATSGIFSACMIGLGRAAGETMIVLMASGRTPIIDVNIFNGLSALSANIATELPEAPVSSTHYRMLFLSALVLFAVTFVVNTTAEVIRIRFRKRTQQL